MDQKEMHAAIRQLRACDNQATEERRLCIAKIKLLLVKRDAAGRVYIATYRRYCEEVVAIQAAMASLGESDDIKRDALQRKWDHIEEHMRDIQNNITAKGNELFRKITL